MRRAVSTTAVLMAALAAAVVLGTPYQGHAALVGYFGLDGNLTDASGQGNNGTYNTGTPIYVADRFGNASRALQFNGASQVAIGTNGRGIDNFSFGGWIQTSATHEIDPETNWTTDGTSGQHYAFWPDQGGPVNGGAGLSVGTNGLSVYEHGDGYMPALAVSNAAVGSGWNHVMVVYNSKQPTIYLNGVPVHTGLTSPRTSVNAPIAFGGGAYGYLSGVMDDMVFYNNALTPQEVQRLGSGGVMLVNPSFEADTFPVWPGYPGGGNPAAITGWAGGGINPVVGGGSPFADNGVIPDGKQVAFLQGGSTSQLAVGFQPGETYVLTYRENARTGATARGTTTLGGQTVVADHAAPAVGGSSPYRYIGSKIFTATSSANLLTFSDTATSGDHTLLLDNVAINHVSSQFADNFSVAAASTNINPSSNDLPGRQTGIYTPQSYTVTPGASYQVNDPEFPGALRLGASGVGATVSPNHNFKDFVDSRGAHYVVEYRVDPAGAGTTGLSSWAAVVVGASSQTPFPDTSDGIGFFIRGNGGYAIFDGTGASNVLRASGNLTDSPLFINDTGYYNVRVNYFVPGFDDTTPGMVAIFVNDILISSFTTTSGFANNFITLIGEREDGPATITHGFDDFHIWSTAVPEPSTVALLGIGFTGLLGYVSRRRRS